MPFFTVVFCLCAGISQRDEMPLTFSGNVTCASDFMYRSGVFEWMHGTKHECAMHWIWERIRGPFCIPPSICVHEAFSHQPKPADGTGGGQHATPRQSSNKLAFTLKNCSGSQAVHSTSCLSSPHLPVSAWEVYDVNLAGCTICGSMHVCRDGVCLVEKNEEGHDICTITGMCVKMLSFSNEEFVDTVSRAAASESAGADALRSYASGRDAFSQSCEYGDECSDGGDAVHVFDGEDDPLHGYCDSDSDLDTAAVAATTAAAAATPRVCSGMTCSKLRNRRRSNLRSRDDLVSPTPTSVPPSSTPLSSTPLLRRHGLHQRHEKCNGRPCDAAGFPCGEGGRLFVHSIPALSREQRQQRQRSMMIRQNLDASITRWTVLFVSRVEFIYLLALPLFPRV